jgi:hypothetical protein
MVRRPLRPITAALCCTLAAIASLGATAAASRPAARASRTVALNETGQLHRTGSSAPTLNQPLNEEGTAAGTICGPIYIHLHIVSNSRVTAEVNIYPRGGSLSGHGSASYHVNGAYAVFSGSLTVTRGTGSYAHARASSLRFTGTIQRRSDAVAVQLSGPLSV